MSAQGDDDEWNSNATMEEFKGTPSTHLSPYQRDMTPPQCPPPGSAGEEGNWDEFKSNASSCAASDMAGHAPKPRENITLPSSEKKDYTDVFSADINDAVPSVRADFATSEDAVQTMIALASMPLGDVHEIMSVPMPTLLSRLSAEPRAKELEEYRDPPLPPHPSSTLLLVKKRLHDEYRVAKMQQRERHLSEEESIKNEYEAKRNAMLEQHRKALAELASQEASYAPPMPVPTARSIQVLEKQLADVKSETVDAGTRRLAAFWKSKYEKTCGALVLATEKLSNATHEFTHLSQMNGRDPSYLEKALAALRDGEIEEQMRGDSIKQQFLLECRRRGMTPDEVSSRRFAAAGTKGVGVTATKRTLKARRLSGDDTTTGGGNAEQGDDDAVYDVGAEGAGGGLYLLPEDVNYVESFSESGYRVPIVRDVGLRIEALRKEIEVADQTFEYIAETLDQKVFDLDDLQTRYSEVAGAMVFDEDLPVVEESIRKWAEVEKEDHESYYATVAAFREARNATREATERAMSVGRSELKIKSMQAELNQQKQILDVEYAQQKLLDKIPNDAEKAHLTYLNAQLGSLAAERKLLLHEMFEVERKARGYATEVDAKLKMTDFDTYYGYMKQE